ncbi:uncharacterized protein PV06_03476 [Exophiala oligosperma]|uniref:Uncharacterized protein n=1 Tax=Exophiala oligosperma TaxID=215243 RepID=A0A0D2DRR2_9EURO|nr:uncharacterized protein PV06_03476 [Exophiala oligosperma]KIW45055.1 hypothetical protein PV06_03476 [Exophiala oligosperma]
MRLLHTTKYTLEEFYDEGELWYAILSHTWAEEEVTFQDLTTTDRPVNFKSKNGFEKLRKTCLRAKEDGFEYVWIDTCCINKQSSAELSESINSMYRWYQNAAACYAYLADVIFKPIQGLDQSGFYWSQWFRRGWTLQELIAPSIVIFLDQSWAQIGTKSTLSSVISKVTGIPKIILHGGNLDEQSIATRLSWASQRQTTRTEDIAYCLLGLFDINMPLLYGEGERAFVRLQEEIIKVSTDYSIFAWSAYSTDKGHSGIMASHPRYFQDAATSRQMSSSKAWGGAASIDSEGIHMRLRLVPIDKDEDMIALLPCRANNLNLNAVAVVGFRIRKTAEGSYERHKQLIFADDKVAVKYAPREICLQRTNMKQRKRPTPLQATTSRNKIATMSLPDNGADPNTHSLEMKIDSGDGKDHMTGIPLEHGPDHSLTNPDLGETLMGVGTWLQEDVLVHILLEHDADLSSYPLNTGWSPLDYALINGNEAIAKFLLKMGGERDHINPKIGDRLLEYTAVQYYSTDAIVRLLRNHGAFPNLHHPETGDTPLELAMYLWHNREGLVGLLLQHGADPNATNLMTGETLLEFAVREGLEDVVDILLKHGAFWRSLSQYEGCLYTAMCQRQLGIVAPLAERGGELFSALLKKRTTWEAALQTQDHRILDCLLKHTHTMPPQLMSLLSHEELYLDHDFIRVLLQYYPALIAIRGLVSAHLHNAITQGRVDTVKLFLDHGVEDFDMTERNLKVLALRWPRNAISELVRAKCPRLREAMVSHAPLKFALIQRNEKLVKRLIENGVSGWVMTVEDRQSMHGALIPGNIPCIDYVVLYHALQWGNHDVVRLLLQTQRRTPLSLLTVRKLLDQCAMVHDQRMRALVDEELGWQERDSLPT